MEGLVAAVQTRKISSKGNQLAPECDIREKQTFSLNSPEAALEALKSKPDLKELRKVLRWLNSTADGRHDFNIKKPGPKVAQIVYVLVNDIVPDYWATLSGGNLDQPKERGLLIRCLSGVTGIGAIISRLHLLFGKLREHQGQAEVLGIRKSQFIEDLLAILEAILDSDGFVASTWNDVNSCISQSSQIFLQWKEFVNLVASGRVLSTASEASFALNELSQSVTASSWVGDGQHYAAWLGKNVQHMINSLPEDAVEGHNALSQILKKALSLGYTDQFVEAAFSDIISGDDLYLRKIGPTMSNLSAHEQKSQLYSIIRTLSKRHLSHYGPTGAEGDSDGRAQGGVAALLTALIETTHMHQDLLVDWLVGTSAEAVSHNHNVHRAVIAALSSHTVNAQILLMLTGYAYRADQKSLKILARSSVYLNAISNRIAASSQRARFLGMVAGTAISGIVDAEDKRMVFSAEELSSSDGQWYSDLTTVNDMVGSVGDLKPTQVPSNKSLGRYTKSAMSYPKVHKPPGAPNTGSRIISIEEVEDGSETEVEDLPMYEKPDSDPSDDDEDPTLVQRNGPTAPVYIRDLMAGLRDTETFDRHKLALATASSLIRRKASFGTEVSENIEELATLLVGLSDKWEMENFQQMRLQGMIAVLVAEPLKMGQWFCMTFYNGDYSMGQRASVLTTLGLGARELAGLGNEDAALTGASASEISFASERLPDKLHKIYALEAGPMNTLSQQLERSIIQPLAAEAADKVSGPNALKVRTFSSRIAVEKRRQRPTPNALAKIVAEGFFFPLTGRWRIHLQVNGENSTHTSPFLLAHLLKTLSLILHASGSSTLSLPQMTSEFWDLLLSLRPRATDPSVLEALLFAFLTLLDINENDQRRLAEEHAKELLETQEWVGNVFELIGGGSEEGDRKRMLAASVLMRTKDVVEKYQRMLMGNMIDFM